MKIIIDSQDKISSMAASMIAEHAKGKTRLCHGFCRRQNDKEGL